MTCFANRIHIEIIGCMQPSAAMPGLYGLTFLICKVFPRNSSAEGATGRFGWDMVELLGQTVKARSSHQFIDADMTQQCSMCFH